MLRSNKRCRRMLELSFQQNENSESENSDADKSRWRKVFIKNNIKNNDSQQNRSEINIVNPGPSKEPETVPELQRNYVSRGTASTITITAPKKRKYNVPEPDTSRLSPIHLKPLFQTDLENTPRARKVQLLNEGDKESIYVSPSTGKTLQVLKNAETLPRNNPQTQSIFRSPAVYDTKNASTLTSRCSSVSDISCAKSLPCPLNKDAIDELLAGPSFEDQQNESFLETSSNNMNAASPAQSPNLRKTVRSPLNNDAIDNIAAGPSFENYQNESFLETSSNNVNVASPAYSTNFDKTARKIGESVDIEPTNEDHSDTDEDFNPNLISSQSDTSSTSSGSDFSVSEDDSENVEEMQPNVIPPVANSMGEDEWQDIDDTIPNFEEFTENCKINIPDDAVTPEDYYNLFVTKDIIAKMVVETNNYAQKFIAGNQVKPKSRVRAWIPTDQEEMKKFLGVIMVMGLVKLPHINDYWSRKSIYRNQYVVSAMKRDRFLLILKFWHFSQEDPDDRNKLAKIKDVFSMLLQRFHTVLIPGKYLVIDESMIPWRGRLKFRQYLKGKSHKYGVKLYKLCTPDGYTFNVNVYTGKGDNGRELNHGKETVLRLIRGLENEGRTVVTDNFYNSIDLAEELIRKKTFLCGTLRPNRKGLPKRIVASKLKKGQITGAMNENGVRIIKWVDKRPVNMISTCRDHDLMIKDTGKIRRTTGEAIKKPQCIMTYNENKKGIDFSDQMSSYYTTLKRGIKWFRKVMLELLFGTALVNSWVVYNIRQPVPISKKDFIEAIIAAYTKTPITDTNSDGQNEVVLKKKHNFEKKGEKRRICAGCYQKLRGTLNSREANRKVKKIKSFCVECKKGYCLSCFYKTHM
ncbi:piggyBac transposable element-derived protein 4-like [Cydia pomonella]|uniref:piggyBac transposable element-derived protein 4-like n=1 Tax=Cydia pomonella TaxID=82600 RepID=UPI002ADD4BAE|nr:piggyBac transposable element-derived protein 4-like [Cydia pomonella]XP_061711490.1 piggyBac transposable element-derived protein 4-like [Cydia pomonella]XP_061715570.1 piggyBac transposable element-derived protein 4-like [Cydia pomonella]XP_061717172.1 piggyBac transposable element-derived protein 4-like [Cydia pomonella]XP_061727914.1 piggyBac transposable element-derived protein 4-like [Cydia pomonella]